jgi:hypothetical protein
MAHDVVHGQCRLDTRGAGDRRERHGDFRPGAVGGMQQHAVVARLGA